MGTVAFFLYNPEYRHGSYVGFNSFFEVAGISFNVVPLGQIMTLFGVLGVGWFSLGAATLVIAVLYLKYSKWYFALFYTLFNIFLSAVGVYAFNYGMSI